MDPHLIHWAKPAHAHESAIKRHLGPFGCFCTAHPRAYHTYTDRAHIRMDRLNCDMCIAKGRIYCVPAMRSNMSSVMIFNDWLKPIHHINSPFMWSFSIQQRMPYANLTQCCRYDVKMWCVTVWTDWKTWKPERTRKERTKSSLGRPTVRRLRLKMVVCCIISQNLVNWCKNIRKIPLESLRLNSAEIFGIRKLESLACPIQSNPMRYHGRR